MAKQATKAAPKAKAAKPAAKSLDEIVGADETPARTARATSKAKAAKSNDDELAQLQDDLDNAPETEDFAEAWRFEEPGDQFVGRVVSVSSNTNEYGEYPILTCVDNDGDLHAIHGLGTILKRELAKAVEGSLVAVRYQGEKQGQGGRSYKDYKVIVRKG